MSHQDIRCVGLPLGLTGGLVLAESHDWFFCFAAADDAFGLYARGWQLGTQLGQEVFMNPKGRFVRSRNAWMGGII